MTVNDINILVFIQLVLILLQTFRNIDKLTICIRYVSSIEPVECFLTFIIIENHICTYLASNVLEFLVENEIDINSCHGKSYDNASHMSGSYSGTQAVIKTKIPFADFIPRTAHLLVG